MRGINKKMFISILTSVIVFVTMVATTFAWVGIFTYANTDSFQMNLKVNKSSSYFLTIAGNDSTSNSDYGEDIPLVDLQKQVLNNWNITIDDKLSASAIDAIYINKTQIESSTPTFDSNENISGFTKLANLSRGTLTTVESNSVIKFDIYLSVNTLEGIDEETTGINSNVVLDELQNTLIGIVNNYNLHNGNTIRKNQYAPSGFDWQLYPAHRSLTTISYDEDGNAIYNDKENVQIDSSSAARFAFEIYNPIKLTDTYTGNETPANTIVYQGGSALPTYDENTGIYSMGGILPEEYNFAIQEANSLFYRNLKIPKQTLEYESKVRTLTGSKQDNLIWICPNYSDIDTTSINYLGCIDGIQTKQKISVYFWFEGWDSDCTWAIDMKKVTLNLTFTADIDE